MKQRQIDFFFKTLDRGLGKKAEIILIGAAAGALMGHIRPSLDLDFEIRLRSKMKTGDRRLVESAIQQASSLTGLAVNWSENIAGWSMIGYLDYRKTAIGYKNFGKIQVRLIAPAYWTIGKMARFLELDVQDMIKIIKKKKISPQMLVRIWARAVNASDLSLELGQFRDHVAIFFEDYGKKAWGREFESQRYTSDFLKRIENERV